MGVRGLTTFITNNDRYWERYKLHDTFVIIDGNSLGCQLIFSLHGIKERTAFGGDYDRYAHHVKDFFQMLSKCNVKSVVVFDGGCEKKKIKTILKRLEDKTAEIERVIPASNSAPVVFPLLMRHVFREVLLEIGVPIVQCDFEADQEISALGLEYNCPILSNDSDFFITGVQYIPITTIEHVARPLRNEAQINTTNQFYIHCKIFRIENLLNHYRGLNISMLSLLSALAGNDYVEIHFFRKFYLQLGIGDRYPADLRVTRVIEWLSSVGSFESALRRILRTIEKNSQHLVLEKIEETINSYNCKNLTVESYLPSIITCPSSNPDLHNAKTNQVQENHQNISQVKSNTGVKFPNWLLNSCRKGYVNSTVIEIFTINTCFAYPQVENISLNPCHEVSIPLLRALIKIIHGDNRVSIDYWARYKNSSIKNYRLEPLNINLPNLESTHGQSPESRRNILLRLLNVPADFCIDIFPEEWKLYLCTIFYWIKNTTNPLITEVHVKSLILCLIALNIIDSKLGFVREMSQFLKIYGAKLRGHTISPTKPHRVFRDLLSDVDVNDCIVCYDSLFKFHRLNENLRSNIKIFSYSNIHAFAQFQTSLQYSMMINSVLSFPLEQCKVHKLFSGTFVYNVCSTLKISSNVEEVVEKLLGESPRIFEVFKTLVSKICRPTAPTAAPMTSTAALKASTAAPKAWTAAPTAAPRAPTAALTASTAAPTAAPTASTAALEASTAWTAAPMAAPTAFTAAPRATTAALTASTAAPTAWTAAPTFWTAALEVSTAAPTVWTAVSTASTAAPRASTAALAASTAWTAAPTALTAAPTASTAAPRASTAALAASTAAPTAWTAAPTAAQWASTAAPTAWTAAPMACTSVPRARTAAPMALTAAPTAWTAALTASMTALRASMAAPTALTAAPKASTAAPRASTAALSASMAAPMTSTASTALTAAPSKRSRSRKRSKKGKNVELNDNRG